MKFFVNLKANALYALLLSKSPGIYPDPLHPLNKRPSSFTMDPLNTFVGVLLNESVNNCLDEMNRGFWSFVQQLAHALIDTSSMMYNWS